MEIIYRTMIFIFIIGLLEYIYRVVKHSMIYNEIRFLVHTNFIDFLKFILIDIPMYIYDFIKNSVLIIISPINLIRVIAEKLTYINWRDIYFPNIQKLLKKISTLITIPLKYIYGKINKFYKKKFESVNHINQQIEIFFECISSYIQKDNPLNNTRASRHIIGLGIIGLQFGISYITTLAGAKLIFSSLSIIAPYIFAAVIQGLIVVFSMKAFEKRRKNSKYMVALIFTVIVSICFSYTGIVISQDSPKKTYQAAYETYEKTFNTIKEESLSNLYNDENMKDRLKQILENIKSNGEIIQDMKENYNNNLSSTESPTRKTETRRDENGQPYTAYIDGVREYEEYINSSKIELQNIINRLDNILNLFPEVLKKDISDDLVENVYDVLKNSSKKVSGDTVSIEKINQLIKEVNSLKNELNLTGFIEIKEDELNDLNSSVKLYEQINEIILTPSKDLFGSNKNDRLSNSSEKSSLIKMIQNIFKTGVSSDMSDLATIREEIRSNAENSYKKLEILGAANISDDKKDVLKRAKEEVMSLPSIFSYAISVGRLQNRDTKDFIIMLIIALFVDGFSAYLGYIREKQNDSFIYVKNSKDYFEQYDDIFEVLFTSLMSSFKTNIVQGNYTELEGSSFRNQCLNYISVTTDRIRSFLELFEISEGSYRNGYNLKCVYDKEKLREYTAIISFLLKTNLLKLISKKQYDQLYKKQFCDSENSDNNAKFYLLLRSKGENYLRENMPFQYIAGDIESKSSIERGDDE
ncbi:hypothetical protein IMSAGC017_01317 [Thomasclavelia cocleata]|uniref:Uncharacterized protein n=1 Tax=Thomasclavelia cocleata TaxID=69824 RepID=A0A829ZE46_9FIRM|nr:hypothetical protein [Thomasclavelia cocleata]GFI41274.1 hypothetical protein IMSAGC017_01317 [Thomasclavelia cocleata]